ncbi:MAG: hypothetical protein IKY42_07970 [Bacteroidaceae bacterium]|nr:hypothetical protein [Bacteroidaceae bacterium]
MSSFTNEQIEQFLEEFFNVVGTRQYIGARYIPLFGRKDEQSIEWDNSLPYEPLTVVLYQGNSFTSRTYVPAGVDINNPSYWAETGNYNAQIEQYRADILQIANVLPLTDFDAVHTVKDYVDDNTINAKKLKVHCLGGTVGSFYIIEYDNVFIVNDCGEDGTQSYIRQMLQSVVGTNKLSAVVCSHFHYDHDACALTIKDWCDDSTDVFIQMEPSQSNSQYSSYQERKASFMSVFPNAVVPVDQSIHQYGLVKLKLFNTDDSVKAIYDSTPANKSATPLTLDSGLNNYSLQALYMTPVGNYLNGSDCEGVAQEFNASKISESVALLHMPHHTSNFTCYYDYFVKANAEMYETVEYTNNPAFITRRNCGAILRYEKKPITINNTASFTISIYGNKISNINGGFTYYYSDWFTNTRSYYSMLSPSYYNRDPWYVFRMSADEFGHLISDYATYGTYSVNLTGTDGGVGGKFGLSLLEDYYGYLGITVNEGQITTSNAVITFDIKEYSMTIRRANSQSYTGIVELVMNFSSSSSSLMRLKVRYIQNHAYLQISDATPITERPTQYTITDTDFLNALKSANNVILRCHSASEVQYDIPLVRSTVQDVQTHNSWFRGCYFSATSSHLYMYMATVSTSGKVTANSRALDNPLTQTDLYLSEICVP